MNIQAWIAFGAVSLVTACGSDPPPVAAPDPSPAESGPASLPAPVTPAPVVTNVPAPEPPAPAPPPKPKSAATIAGASITDVDGSTVVSEMKKAGWVDLAVALTGGSVGAYENIRFDLKKGKSKGHLEIVRPLKNPPAGSTFSGMASPKEQKPDRDKEGATYFDEPADVLVVVVIDGDGKQAKRLLDGLVKVPKLPKKN